MVKGARFQALAAEESFWHEGRSADIWVGDKLIGRLGEIHPQVLRRAGLERRVLAFELYEEELASCCPPAGDFRGINRLPRSEFDLAVVVDKSMEWQRLADAIAALKEPDIVSVRPFDVYAGENIAPGQKSVALRVACQGADRTLSDEEIKGVMDRVIGALTALGGTIRK